MASKAAKDKERRPHPKHERVVNGKRYKSEGALLIATNIQPGMPRGVTNYLLRTAKGAYFMLIESEVGAKEKDILPYCWEAAYQAYTRMAAEVPVEEAFPSVEVEEA